jgi:hypothetical protein
MLRDPLIHFLVVGGLLFAVFAWRDDGSDPELIEIPAARVRQLASSAAVLEGREPTREELEALVEPLIREEVYYREAVALGLDVDDDEVRRRLVEKMQYLTENLADPDPATEAELEAFYAANPARFAIPETATFDQIFFSPDRRGDAIDDDITTALEALAEGADPAAFGDRTPLDSRLEAAARQRVEVLFGTEMTAAVFGGPENRWLGPFQSDFGHHLIRVVGRTMARIPTFAEAEARVRESYAAEKRAAANEAAYREIRERYEVVVDWPAGGDAG